MLWNVVFDFFIKYVFGGVASDYNVYQGALGLYTDFEGENEGILYTSGALIKTNFYGDYDLGVWKELYLPFGNYLSLIATIITMVALLIACILIVKKIISVFMRVFSFGV